MSRKIVETRHFTKVFSFKVADLSTKSGLQPLSFRTYLKISAAVITLPTVHCFQPKSVLLSCRILLLEFFDPSKNLNKISTPV